MVKCSFCGREENPHKGVHFVRNTGVVLFFCRSKCRKNMLKLGRDKRRVRWTQAYVESRDKSKAKHAAAVAKKE